jgi:hypothetical protein
MTKALKRCPGGHDLGGYTLGSGNAGSSSFSREGTATWHGGRTDVMVTRPGRTAANDALVTAPAVTALWGQVTSPAIEALISFQSISTPSPAPAGACTLPSASTSIGSARP